MKYAFLIVCLSVSLLAGGCAELQGKSVKTYQLEYNDAVQASTDALENLEISVLDVEADELKTDILARRGDGTPVTVEVKRVDRVIKSFGDTHERIWCLLRWGTGQFVSHQPRAPGKCLFDNANVLGFTSLAKDVALNCPGDDQDCDRYGE